MAVAYLFLGDVEHKLQMVHDLQTDASPESTEELEPCVVWMGMARSIARRRSSLSMRTVERHTEMVYRTFQSLCLEPKTSPLFRATLKTIGLQS